MTHPELILNADDLGATPAITRRILDAWQRGWLNGFSLLGNGDALDLVEEGLASCDRPARVMAHLNLSEGRALADPARVPLLVDDDGWLKHGFGSLLRLGLGPASASSWTRSRRSGGCRSRG